MVFKCLLCSSFTSTTYKGVLRHLGSVHTHDAGFHVVCVCADCPRRCNKFHSYKTHLYRKHREMLVDSVKPADAEDDPELEDFDSPQQGDDCITPAAYAVKRKREGALFSKAYPQDISEVT